MKMKMKMKLKTKIKYNVIYKMKIVEILLSLLISSIIMISYYFSVFSQDRINTYSNFGYFIFISHLIILLILTTVIIYLFLKTILNSKIYPRSRSGKELRQPLIYDYNSPDTYETRYPINTLRRFPSSISNFTDMLNENTKRIFRGSQTPSFNKYVYTQGTRGEKWE